MRVQAKSVLTAGVLTVAGLVVVAAAGLRFLRLAAERDHDALAESVAAQELIAADLVPAAPAAETAPRADAQMLQLDSGPRVAETLETLHVLAESNGVVLSTCRPIKTTERGRVEFTATGGASGRCLCAFLAQVERHPRLFAIGQARFRPATLDRVAFDITITAFHEEAQR